MTRDAGFVAVEWSVGLGLLVVPVVLLVASLAPWFQHATIGAAIAQQTARTVVLADDWTAGIDEAVAVAERIGSGHGIAVAAECAEPGCLSLAVTSDRGGLVRGAEVTVTVRLYVPAVTVPFLTSVGSFPWETTHTERVDDYRSLP